MLIILIGNIATGKTTYRKEKFKNKEIIICPDEWHQLSSEDREEKFYSELHKHLSKGEMVVIDGNNICRNSRKKYKSYARTYGQKLVAIDFGQGNDETLNRPLSQKPQGEHSKWVISHEGYLSRYEKPSLEEGFNCILDAINYK